MAARTLGPATLAVVQAVEAALQPTDRRLVVACSGGADSLALAFAARHVAVRRGLPYAALVIDHGLQVGSAAAADAAQKELVGLDFGDVRVIPVKVDQDSPHGIEAAARQARYRALEAESFGTGSTILLGHTLDDQAETVLLGLARGSGTRSLAGMAPRVRHLLRPLLPIRRATTAQVCAELGLTVWQDPHNVDPAFSRVRVRHRVLPVLEAELGPGIAEALARTADLARDDADLLDALAAEHHRGSDTLTCSALVEQPAALRRRVLRRWLLAHGIVDLSFQHIAGVDALLTNWHGQYGVQVPSATVRRIDGRLHCLAAG